MADIVDLSEIVPPEIGHCQFAEDVVEDRGRPADMVVARHFAGRLKPREDKGVDILFQRHAVLQADRDRDGEVIHQRAEGGAFLVHVDEDLAELAIVELPRVQVDLVSPHGRLLDVTPAPIRQATTLGDVVLVMPMIVRLCVKRRGRRRLRRPFEGRRLHVGRQRCARPALGFGDALLQFLVDRRPSRLDPHAQSRAHRGAHRRMHCHA